MKQSLIFLALLGTVCSASAQIDHGKLLLGFDAATQKHSLQNQGSKAESNGYGIFDISAGIASKKNKVWGLNAGITTVYFRRYNLGTDTLNSHENDFSIGLFYRQYFPAFRRFYFFAEGSVAYEGGTGRNNYTATPVIDHIKRSGVAIGLNPGISYELRKKLQINLFIPNLLYLQYLQQKISYENSVTVPVTEKDFAAGTSFSGSSAGGLGVGFRLIL